MAAAGTIQTAIPLRARAQIVARALLLLDLVLLACELPVLALVGTDM